MLTSDIAPHICQKIKLHKAVIFMAFNGKDDGRFLNVTVP